jgi:hypothetical protein
MRFVLVFKEVAYFLLPVWLVMLFLAVKSIFLPYSRLSAESEEEGSIFAFGKYPTPRGH